MADYIDNINPRRIEWCCKQAGIDVPTLAGTLKFKKEKLTECRLTYKQLAKVASHFGHTTFFFMRKDEPAKSALSPIFRTIANQGNVRLTPNLYRIIRQAEQHRDAYVHFRKELGMPAAFELPPLSGTIKAKAKQTRQWLGLDDGGTYKFEDYRSLLDAKGILVIRSQGFSSKQWKLSHPTVIGFCMPDERVPIIFVKKEYPPQRQTFTMFHELGHLLLHGKRGHIDSDDTQQSDQAAEREANRFAGRCLVPDSAIREIEGKIPPSAGEFDSAFRDLADRLGVSVEVIVRVLLEEGKIGDALYGEYRRIVKRRMENQPPRAQGWGVRNRPTEPLHIFGSRYVRVMLDAANERKVTLGRASDYLDNLSVLNIRALEEHLLNG